MPIEARMDVGKATQSIGDLVGSIPSAVVDSLDSLYASMVQGGQSFWVAVYAPYMKRDLTNSHVRAMIDRGLKETRGSYKVLLELFNIPPEEYREF